MTEETIKYYRNLFKKFLEGKEINQELVDYIITHENKWLRNVFRHYIQYLYFRRQIPLEVYGWLIEVVPSRKYQLKVRVFEIDYDQFYGTLEHLRENHELYYLYYLLMYYSGIRLEHVVKLVAEFRPNEVVYVPILDKGIRRLACFKEKGFCRYYLGYGDGKPCEWVYFPKNSSNY